MYAINILPALGGLIKRDEEMVWECLSESIQPIAIFIFPHTSQQELINVSDQSTFFLSKNQWCIELGLPNSYVNSDFLTRNHLRFLNTATNLLILRQVVLKP